MTPRQKFEQWISVPPFDKDVDRHPNDDAISAWPGQYRDYAVQLAWEAWCEASGADPDPRKS